jgi:hypothetical protein
MHNQQTEFNKQAKLNLHSISLLRNSFLTRYKLNTGKSDTMFFTVFHSLVFHSPQVNKVQLCFPYCLFVSLDAVHSDCLITIENRQM